MTQIGAGLIVAAVLVGLWALMYWGWKARTRRQSTWGSAGVQPLDPGELLHSAEVLYVATSLADAPLERVTVPGLRFRGRANVSVYTSGVRIAVVGEPVVFIPVDSLRNSGAATWTVDRVVEEGGLVTIGWRLTTEAGAAGTAVESNFRVIEVSDRRSLIEAVAGLVGATDTASEGV